MMLTGGSPTMHPKLVNELTHFAHERDILITIETEGSHFSYLPIILWALYLSVQSLVILYPWWCCYASWERLWTKE
jgi:organic radical activating enzyme